METTSKVALITGASRGIGRAIAERFAREGWRLALVARVPAPLGTALCIAADLRDAEAPAAIVARVTKELGVPDVLVNNAGTAPSDKLESTSDAVLDEVLDLHLKAAFRLVRALTPAWKARGSGTAVQIASSAGLRGYPFTAAYTAGKHAMVGLTRALAAEWSGTALRAVAVCPGFVDTEITREAARKLAARGKQTFEQALLRFGAMNEIGRLHSVEQVAEWAWRAATDPTSITGGVCVDMDHAPERFA